MSTGKAKVIVKVGNDFFRIAENIFKMFKGSKDVLKSSATAAKREGRTIRNASQSKIKDQAQLNRLSRADKADVARRGLKTADDKTKNIDLKSRYLKNGKPSGAAGSKTKPINGRRKTKVDKKDTKKVEPETISQVTRKGVVSKTVTPKVKGKGGIIINPFTKKPFTTKAKWLAAGGIGSWATYVAATSGSKKPNGAASTTPKPKPPKPPTASSTTGPVTTAPAPPSVLSAQAAAANQTKPPKPSGMSSNGGPPQTQATKSEPKTLEQKLKAKFVKFRGGEDAFGKKGSDAAWKTEVLNMREGSEGGYTYTDQQNYDKIIAERKELASATKKKRGGVIKRNKGGPVRGVGKALRGYGNNSIYSNKMY